MSLEINDGGIDKTLLRLSRGNKQMRSRALTKASSVIENKLKSNTPVWSGEDGNSVHARDHVVTSGVFSDKEGDLNIKVGYSKEVYWRIKFVEFGTVHQAPQGFINQTATQNNQVVLQIIARELRRELGL